MAKVRPCSSKALPISFTSVVFPVPPKERLSIEIISAGYFLQWSDLRIRFSRDIVLKAMEMVSRQNIFSLVLLEFPLICIESNLCAA